MIGTLLIYVLFGLVSVNCKGSAASSPFPELNQARWQQRQRIADGSWHSVLESAKTRGDIGLTCNP